MSGADVTDVLTWCAGIGADVALPGDGATGDRWELLATVAAQDLTVARVLEPHLDAVAILAEDGQEPSPSSTWGVWAAEGPEARLVARADEDGQWALTGRKPWCSLAGVVSHALVTAWLDGDERRLFAVEMSHPGVTVEEGTWVPSGLADVVTTPVRMEQVRGVPVGAAGWYLQRDGFWWGGIGVAAVWYGGAVGLARRLATHVRSRDPDQLSLMHLGEVDAALSAARSALTEAAAPSRRRLRDGTEGDAARRPRTPHRRLDCRRGPTTRGPRTGSWTAEPGTRSRRPSGGPRALRTTASRRARCCRSRPHAARERRGVPTVVTFSAAEAGTGAEEWTADPRLTGLPRVMLDPAEVEHVVVLAAHPDDESLGAGGLLSQAARTGLRMTVVVATDGEASHPASPTHSADQLARLRRDELQTSRRPARAECVGRAARPSRRSSRRARGGSARLAGRARRRWPSHPARRTLAPRRAPRPRSGRPGRGGDRRPHRCQVAGVPDLVLALGTAEQRTVGPFSSPRSRRRRRHHEGQQPSHCTAVRSSRCPTSPETRCCWVRTLLRHFAGDREIYVAEPPSDLALDDAARPGRRSVGHRLAVVRDPQAHTAPRRAPAVGVPPRTRGRFLDRRPRCGPRDVAATTCW